MELAATGWAQALQDSSFAASIRGTALLYPLVNTVHVLAIALLVGAIVSLDLRILGFVRSVPAAAASRLLTPIAAFGLLLAIPSGFALYASDAVTLSRNYLMWTKLVLIALGVVNALLFRKLWNRQAHAESETPALGKAQAFLSIAIWLTVPALGRLIAYF